MARAAFIAALIAALLTDRLAAQRGLKSQVATASAGKTA